MNWPPPPPPPAVRARPRPASGIGVKRPQGPRRDKKWKIKCKIPNIRNIDVKHRGQVVRKMTVRRRAIYPPIVGRVY